MNLKKLLASIVLVSASIVPQTSPAAEIILPEMRKAYYASESIELAVTGANAVVSIQIGPKFEGAQPVELQYPAGTTSLVIPPYMLAPGQYGIKLDGVDTSVVLTVASGLHTSEMLLSQTTGWDQLKSSGSNFIVGNSFSWGVVGPDGAPLLDARAQRSTGWGQFERAVEMDLPTVVYMYWTGYVTHKPFGSHKSWAASEMTESLRLLNFSTGQNLRRFNANVVKIGTLDEPGLAWGKTPAGGSASGFPGWDEQAWYEQRGWTYTQDIGNQSDADWMKYMTIRCEIMKEQNVQAKKDLKVAWPEMIFATDLYALHAIMDGTEGMNQEVNDIPTSHVFADWGIGRVGMYSGILLEKCDDPTRPFAHAMNGQLFEPVVQQPNQTDAYRACLNSMYMAGLYSNWWLNMQGMTPETLNSVNEPGKRIGSLFKHVNNAEHDIAVIWSFTEMAMRQKEMAAKEASKKDGEQIKLMIASMPETHVDGGIASNAYSIGQDFKDQVLGTHMALARAGYPSHILHERKIVTNLKNYKTLVIVGQTFEFPAEVRKAIEDWQAAGGKIVIDKQTTVPFKGAIVHEGDFADIGYKWGNVFGKATKATGLGGDPVKEGFKSLADATAHLSNYFMDEPQRVAAPKLKEAMLKTDSKPVMLTDSTHLLAERHTGGDGAVYMVLNANDKLPEVAADQRTPIYNFAPLNATFTLQGIAPGSHVWVIEGTDWKKSSKVEKFDGPISASFAAGEMKIYLVSPAEPGELKVSAMSDGGALKLSAEIGVKVPWPITVSVIDPAGNVVMTVYRALDAEGKYEETIPFGFNRQGEFKVRIESPVALKAVEIAIPATRRMVVPEAIADAVRVFDESSIKNFLAAKPAVTIAATEANKSAAEKLMTALKAKGIDASIKPEADVTKKVDYPRVWNPYARLFTPGGEDKQPAGEVKNNVTISTDAAGVVTFTTADGKPTDNWRQPLTLVTVAGEGWLDFSGDMEDAYLPGVKMYVDDKNNIAVLNAAPAEAKTDEAFRAKWSKPWTRLTSYVGGYQFPAQLPHAWSTESHLIVLGDSNTSQLARALQASEILPQIVDAKYPGAGKSLVEFAWSPFSVEKNVIFIGATDEAGWTAGVDRLLQMLP